MQFLKTISIILRNDTYPESTFSTESCAKMCTTDKAIIQNESTPNKLKTKLNFGHFGIWYLNIPYHLNISGTIKTKLKEPLLLQIQHKNHSKVLFHCLFKIYTKFSHFFFIYSLLFINPRYYMPVF